MRILVNSAGIQRRHPVHQFPDADFNEVAQIPYPFPALPSPPQTRLRKRSQVLQVNLNAVFTLTRDLGSYILSLPPHPATGRRGSIINIASVLSMQGGFTVPAYAASKGAVSNLTKSFANEWTEKGVTANAIAPGYIATDMNEALRGDPERLRSINERIPAGRWGAPDDFKGPVVFLASKAGQYVSGHTMLVDGGWMGR